MVHSSLSGWLLFIYPDEQDGVVLWVLGEDGSRRRLTASFLSAFYIGGEPGALKKVAAFLEQDIFRVRSFLTERLELYDGPQQVLAVQTANPVLQQHLITDLKRRFGAAKLRYYYINIPLSVRYAAATGAFPTARCFFSHDAEFNLLNLYPQDSPWEIDYSIPGLRTMTVLPDANPQFSHPASLLITCGEQERTLRLDQPLQVLKEFSSLLDTFDPDILMAHWGDGWLFPALLGWAREFKFDFNPSRDPRHKYLSRDEVTFQSYGVVHYRAGQTFLFGRAHIDPANGTTGGFSMHSTVELARVTALPLETAARNSPGAGFTAMQMAEALRRGVLVPEHKVQTERFKSAAEFNLADNGGLNYRPVVGLHNHVAALDYFSMYPSLMVKMNISGETVGVTGQKTLFVPETHVPITQDVPGLVPSVLKPLLEKRLAVKRRMTQLGENDPRHAELHAIADALKWLGYVSFGYQGFKHNLYGNIQAHEAITAFGREMLVRAIESAQGQGYAVLSANTDSVFVKRPDSTRPAHFQPLIDEINQRTGLVIMPEAIFDWIVFLPSKGNPRIGAVNRYFGRMDNGKPKVRGLAQRRMDTPAWVVQGEKEIIALFLSEPNGNKLAALLPAAVDLMRRKIDDLLQGRVPVSDLIITRRLSRNLNQFKGISDAASAGRQMEADQRTVQAGQKVEYIRILGTQSGVQVVDYVHWPEERRIDKQHYCELLMRAVYQLLHPLGIRESDMPALAGDGIRQLGLFATKPVLLSQSKFPASMD
jgi:DNA polymerase-2